MSNPLSPSLIIIPVGIAKGNLARFFPLEIGNQHSLNLYPAMKIVRFAVNDKVKYGTLRGESVQVIEDTPYRYLKLADRYYLMTPSFTLAMVRILLLALSAGVIPSCAVKITRRR